MITTALIRTLVAPPPEFAWAWALERPTSRPLAIHVVANLTAEAIEPPSEDELVLWFGVPAPRDGADLSSFLSENEQARAAGFHFEVDRWAYAAAHAGLRALLGSMMGCAPQKLRFEVGLNGKPRLDRENRAAALQFSISHTRGCVAVAVARSAVGIDVERRRALPDLMAVARTAFAPEAHATLLALPESASRTELFYRYWTLGEAFTKATGEGIAQDPTSFAFNDRGAPALIRVSAAWGPIGRWRFHCE